MSQSSNLAAAPERVSLGVPPEREGGTPMLTIGKLKESIGERLVGDWFKIDPVANDEFCRSTYLDEIYGEDNAQAAYEEDLIEGFYLVSLVDALKARVFKDDTGFYALNYGSNKLRFIEQVTLRSVLRFSCVIEKVESKGNGYLVELICTLDIKDVERPALVYSSLYYLLPIPSDK